MTEQMLFWIVPIVYLVVYKFIDKWLNKYDHEGE